MDTTTILTDIVVTTSASQTVATMASHTPTAFIGNNDQYKDVEPARTVRNLLMKIGRQPSAPSEGIDGRLTAKDVVTFMTAHMNPHTQRDAREFVESLGAEYVKPSNSITPSPEESMANRFKNAHEKLTGSVQMWSGLASGLVCYINPEYVIAAERLAAMRAALDKLEGVLAGVSFKANLFKALKSETEWIAPSVENLWGSRAEASRVFWALWIGALICTRSGSPSVISDRMMLQHIWGRQVVSVVNGVTIDVMAKGFKAAVLELNKDLYGVAPYLFRSSAYMGDYFTRDAFVTRMIGPEHNEEDVIVEQPEALPATKKVVASIPIPSPVAARHNQQQMATLSTSADETIVKFLACFGLGPKSTCDKFARELDSLYGMAAMPTQTGRAGVLATHTDKCLDRIDKWCVAIASALGLPLTTQRQHTYRLLLLNLLAGCFINFKIAYERLAAVGVVVAGGIVTEASYKILNATAMTYEEIDWLISHLILGGSKSTNIPYALSAIADEFFARLKCCMQVIPSTTYERTRLYLHIMFDPMTWRRRWGVLNEVCMLNEAIITRVEEYLRTSIAFDEKIRVATIIATLSSI